MEILSKLGLGFGVLGTWHMPDMRYPYNPSVSYIVLSLKKKAIVIIEMRNPTARNYDKY